MKAAYADPPYLGCCVLYGHDHRDGCWDSIEAHRRLIQERLVTYDAWALSCSSTSLRDLLPLCPDDTRVAAWVKPFASFKPGVNPAYAWEPVLFHGARKRPRSEPTTRDWLAESITLRRGLTGAKPDAFAFWIFDLLGLDSTDSLADIFPGTGAITAAWQRRCGTHQHPTQHTLSL